MVKRDILRCPSCGKKTHTIVRDDTTPRRTSEVDIHTVCSAAETSRMRFNPRFKAGGSQQTAQPDKENFAKAADYVIKNIG